MLEVVCGMSGCIFVLQLNYNGVVDVFVSSSILVMVSVTVGVMGQITVMGLAHTMG